MKERKGIGKDHQLTFSEKNQAEVFEKLQEQKKKKSSNSFKWMPVSAAALLLMIGAILILPMLTSWGDSLADNPDQESDRDGLTLLLLVSNDQTEYDIEYGVVLIYNPASQSMTMTTIPRDTFMAIFTNDQGGTTENKFGNAAVYNGIEGAAQSVEALLKINIDEVLSFDELSFNKMLDNAGLSNMIPDYQTVNEEDPGIREESRLEVLKDYFEFVGENMTVADIRTQIDASPETAGIMKDNMMIMTVNIMEESYSDRINGVYFERFYEGSLVNYRQLLKRHLSSDEGVFTFTNITSETKIEQNQPYFMVLGASWTGGAPAVIQSVEITDPKGNLLNEDGMDWTLYGTTDDLEIGVYQNEPGELFSIEGYEIHSESRAVLELEADDLEPDDNRRLKVTYSYKGQEREQMIEWETLKQLHTNE